MTPGREHIIHFWFLPLHFLQMLLFLWRKRILCKELNLGLWGDAELTCFRVPVMAQWKQIWLVSMRTQVRSLALLSGLNIWCCHELWCRWKTQLGSDMAVAVAVAYTRGYSSNMTPSLRTSICRRYGPKKTKERKREKERKNMQGSSHDGSAETIWLASMKMQVWSLTLISGLTIWHCCCHELWCRSKTQLRSDVCGYGLSQQLQLWFDA